jgi:hypothetical protein
MATTKKGMTTRDLVLTGILLAAGTVIKAVFPKLPVTPNFIISMYCLAVLLVRPRIVETIGIGVVSAILAQLTTGAAVPFINFASEPIAIVVCYFLCRISFPKGAPSTIIRPAVVSFITTFVSGTVFVLILSFVLLARGSAARYVMIYTVVLPTAVANMVITTICYAPLRRVLNIKDEEPAKAAA